MAQAISGYSDSEIVISIIVIISLLFAAIILRSISLLFLGVLMVLFYLNFSMYVKNSKITNKAIIAILSKLNEQIPQNNTQVNEQARQDNTQLREVDVNGVKIKISDEDYIKLLEAKTKS